jgi:electron transport complex protein RnfA
MKLISLFFTSFLAENIVLTKFLGLCPLIGNSNKRDNALKMGSLVVLTTVSSSLITYLFYHYILAPTNTTHLETLVFIFTIASIVGILEIVMKRFFKNIYQSLGIYLPLITTNCAILGVSLLCISNEFTLIETLVYAFGSSLGFLLVIYIFSTLREKMNKAPIPEGFKGLPIAFITLGIVAMLFSRYGL